MQITSSNKIRISGIVFSTGRVTKTPSARQQCWPESFCKSGKFLRQVHYWLKNFRILCNTKYPDNMQSVRQNFFFRFAKIFILNHQFFSSKLLKWNLVLCLLSPFRVLKKLSQCLHGRLIPSKWFVSMWSLMLFRNPSFTHNHELFCYCCCVAVPHLFPS